MYTLHYSTATVVYIAENLKLYCPPLPAESYTRVECWHWIAASVVYLFKIRDNLWPPTRSPRAPPSGRRTLPAEKAGQWLVRVTLNLHQQDCGSCPRWSTLSTCLGWSAHSPSGQRSSECLDQDCHLWQLWKISNLTCLRLRVSTDLLFFSRHKCLWQ